MNAGITSEDVRNFRHDVCDDLAAVVQKATGSPIAILVAKATDNEPEMFVHACVWREDGVRDVAGHETFADAQSYFHRYHLNFPHMDGRRNYEWKFAYGPEHYTKIMSELLGRDYEPYQAKPGDGVHELAEKIAQMQDRVDVQVDVDWNDNAYTVTLSADGQEPYVWTKEMPAPKPGLQELDQSSQEVASAGEPSADGLEL